MFYRDLNFLKVLMIFLKTFTTRYIKNILKNNNAVCLQALYQGRFYSLNTPVATFHALKKYKISIFHSDQVYIYCPKKCN